VRSAGARRGICRLHRRASCLGRGRAGPGADWVCYSVLRAPSGEAMDQKAVRADTTVVVDSALLFKSVGYRSRPIDGMPFEQATHTATPSPSPPPSHTRARALARMPCARTCLSTTCSISAAGSGRGRSSDAQVPSAKGRVYKNGEADVGLCAGPLPQTARPCNRWRNF
jgi:hypothetical protein